MISKQSLKKAWETTKRGYGQGVRTVQEYAPKLEKRFGRMAQTTTEAFRPIPSRINPEFKTPQNTVEFERPIRRGMGNKIDFGRPLAKRRKRHDFGKLSFDLG